MKAQTTILQAIETKTSGPTDTRGTRYIATSASGQRISVAPDYQLDSEVNHRNAAEALAKKLGWKGQLIQGATKSGYVFVFAPMA